MTPQMGSTFRMYLRRQAARFLRPFGSATATARRTARSTANFDRIKRRTGFGALATLTALALAGGAWAQGLSFEVQNGLTPNEIVTSTQQQTRAPQAQSRADTMARNGQAMLDGRGSYSQVVQHGNRNSAATYISKSTSAAVAVMQINNDNFSQAVIRNSPKSVIAQFQAGNDLISNVAIVGGQENAVSTLQLGNNLGINLGLIDSTGTTIVYGQAGAGYGGSVVFRNAPNGTVIKLK